MCARFIVDSSSLDYVEGYYRDYEGWECDNWNKYMLMYGVVVGYQRCYYRHSRVPASRAGNGNGLKLFSHQDASY